MLVFGGASVTDMLRNWALHVQKLAVPYVVTCMDEKLFALADRYPTPTSYPTQTYLTLTSHLLHTHLTPHTHPTPTLNAHGRGLAGARPVIGARLEVCRAAPARSNNLPGVIFSDNSDGRVTTKWKYFRMDPKAFMTMGILKVAPTAAVAPG